MPSSKPSSPRRGSSGQIRGTLAGLICLVAAFGACLATPFEVWVAPDGADRNDGLSIRAPVATLSRALAVTRMAQPSGEVRIAVKPGAYHGQSLAWTYINGRRISIVGDGWPGHGKERPVFDGCPTASACSLRPNYFLKIVPPAPGMTTNIAIRHLQIQRYQNGVWFGGNYRVEGGFIAGNEVSDNVFRWIGNADVPGLGMGYFAVGLDNTRNSVIAHNTFVDIRDAHPDESEIHALYLSGFSSGNRITNNVFDNISGAAVDVRNASGGNVVTGNRFSRLGAAAFMDWYCDPAYNSGCKTVSPPECPSWNNVFSGNVVNDTKACVLYYGERPYDCAGNAEGKHRYYPNCRIPSSRRRVDLGGGADR